MSTVAAAASYFRPHQINDQQMSRSIPQPLQLTSRERRRKQWNFLNIFIKIRFIITSNSSLDSAWIAVQDSETFVTVHNQLSRIFDTEHGSTLSPYAQTFKVFRMHNRTVKKLQAQLTGSQAVADTEVPALKKTLSFFFRSSRSLPLTLFCRLSDEATENTFSSVKKTKSVAYCGNFWSRSLARFMRETQFASVSSCERHLLKHFGCKSKK